MVPVGLVVLAFVFGWALHADGDVTNSEHTHVYTDKVTRVIDEVRHKTFYQNLERPWCKVHQFDVEYKCDDGDISRKVRERWGPYLGHRTEIDVEWSCSSEGGSKQFSKTYYFPGGGGYNKGTHSWSSFSIPAAWWPDPCRWVVAHTAPTPTTLAPTTTAAPATTSLT